MSEMDFEFEHQGRTVRSGQVLHVSPDQWRHAGPSGKVERYYGDSVLLRADNGAVPIVPLHCLSWEPHPETVAREELREAGFTRPTCRDVAVWMASKACSQQEGVTMRDQDYEATRQAAADRQRTRTLCIRDLKAELQSLLDEEALDGGADLVAIKQEAARIAKAGNFIAAVKHYREKTGLSLFEAKGAVEALMARA